MAAPSQTPRVDPTEFSIHRLDDGFSSVVTFSNQPDLLLWEKSVKPPGMNNGDAIETSTMFNVNFRTKAPKSLYGVTEVTFKCAYDVAVYDQIFNFILGCNQSITVWFPDGSAISFHGWMESFEPDEMVEGQQPEATVTIIPSMYDHENCEEGSFVVYQPTGTCWGGGCSPGEQHGSRPGPG